MRRKAYFFVIGRKRLRLTLRLLLGITALCGIVLGLVVWDLQNYRESARAERKGRIHVKRLGGNITTSPRGPKWLRFIPDSIRPSAPEFVVSVSLPMESTNPAYSNKVIALLGEFEYVKQVYFEGDQVVLIDRRYRPGHYLVDTDELQRKLPRIFYGGLRLD